MVTRKKTVRELRLEEEQTASIQEMENNSLSDVLTGDAPRLIYTPISTEKIISTGSTLLDLAISGGRIRGGGIPSGIMVELYGPSSSGKSTVLVEIGASVQAKGGMVEIADPEARLDEAYTRLHGLQIPADNYTRPDTVTEMFESIMKWNPENQEVINLYGADSIAALCSDLELEDKGDKRGQKKAKDLSEGCRKVARLIAAENKLVVFTNQEKQAEYGKTTPGGFAVGFHSSLRIRISSLGKIERSKKLENKKEIVKVIGIESLAQITKSSIDDGYRTAPLYIVFGFGIDDVRANLQYLKDMTTDTTYESFGKNGVDDKGNPKGYASMDAAIRNIENNNLEGELRDKVIDVWESIELKFKVNRKAKMRF